MGAEHKLIYVIRQLFNDVYMCVFVILVLESSCIVRKYSHRKVHLTVKITQSHFKTSVNMLEGKYKCQVTSEQQKNKQNMIC